MAKSYIMNAVDGQMNLNTGPGTIRSALQSGGQYNKLYNAETMNFTRHEEETSYREVAAWSSPADAMSSHRSALKLHQADTGAWLCTSERYKEWLDNAHHHFWLNGQPGGGKTVLCSIVIEDLKQRCSAATGSALAFFYFSFSDSKKQSYDDMLRSVVTQFAEHDAYLLSELRKAHKCRKPLEVCELESLLQSPNVSDRLYIVLDALDECPEERESREHMLDGILSLMDHTSKVKLFMTSRDLSDIREAMKEANITETAITRKDADADIRRYLTVQLSKDRRLTRFSEEIRVDIKNTIAARSDGMFRWAYLQLQEVKRLDALRPSYVKNALSRMPKTLDETYARILSTIKSDYRDDAVKLLRWIAYAQRPLSLGELRDCVLIDLNANTVHVDDRGDIEDPLRLLSGLVVTMQVTDNITYSAARFDKYIKAGWSHFFGAEGGEAYEYEQKSLLVDSDERTQSSARSYRTNHEGTLVRLAHFSVKEYLESDRAKEQAVEFYLDKSLTHHFLSKSSAQYIMFYSIRRGDNFKTPDVEAYPLIKYASKSWHYHALHKNNEDFSSEVTLLTTFSIMMHWATVHNPGLGCPDLRSAPSFASSHGLCYAASLGLQKVVAILLESGSDVNQLADFHFARMTAYISRSALDVASQKGDSRIVSLLLDAGAHVDLLTSNGKSALVIASLEGHTAIVQLLISRGADVQGSQLLVAINAAAQQAQLQTLRLLLKHATHVNSVDLVDAMSYGAMLKPEMIDCMLFDGLLCESTVKTLYGVALGMAAHQGHAELVRKLLMNGANNITCEHMSCALFSASYVGHVEIVEMLLTYGAQANARENMNGSVRQPLWLTEYTEIGRLLGDNTPVDTSVKDYRGGALQAASAFGRLEIMKLLLDYGADVNATGGPFGSALLAAATQASENFEPLRLLSFHAESPYIVLQRGALSARKLVWRLMDRENPVVSLYIGDCTFENVINMVQDKAKANASSNKRLEAVTLLLDHGADVNTLNCGRESALYAASALNDLNLARLLISRHADVEVGQGYFGSAVCAAAYYNHGEMVKLFAHSGANMNAFGPEGGPLYVAINLNNSNMMKVMLENGADVNARFGHQPALHLACNAGTIETVRLLLDYGAEINTPSDYGRFALSVAESRQDDELVELLLSRGARKK